jgi:hypothetical protein
LASLHSTTHRGGPHYEFTAVGDPLSQRVGVVVFDDTSALWCSVGRDARQSRPAITPRALWPNWIEPDHPDRRSQEPAAATNGVAPDRQQRQTRTTPEPGCVGPR